MAGVELGQGVRPPWSTVPPHVVAAVERWLGGTVERVAEVRGGFSPVVAARVSTTGRTGFVKVSPGDGYSAGWMRNEARIAGALPDVPAVARLRWSFDDGDWLAVGFDDLAGLPPVLPWREHELDDVLAAIGAAHVALTPAPSGIDGLRTAMSSVFSSWASVAGDEPGLDDWSCRHLTTLQALPWPASFAGNTLVHTDLRADNVVLARGRGPVIVDWPAACVGPAWFDLVCFAPSVAEQGGPDCSELLARAGAEPPPDALAFAVAGIAGYFTERALRPPDPQMPTVRREQARQGARARAWAAELLDLA